MTNEPVKVYNWPMGICENGMGHPGIHPLYTSSDGGCRGFVESSRLLEIKQLFDAEATIAKFREALKGLYELVLQMPHGSCTEPDGCAVCVARKLLRGD